MRVEYVSRADTLKILDDWKLWYLEYFDDPTIGLATPERLEELIKEDMLDSIPFSPSHLYKEFYDILYQILGNSFDADDEVVLLKLDIEAVESYDFYNIVALKML